MSEYKIKYCNIKYNIAITCPSTLNRVQHNEYVIGFRLFFLIT
jgi:hypothetical protein